MSGIKIKKERKKKKTQSTQFDHLMIIILSEYMLKMLIHIQSYNKHVYNHTKKAFKDQIHFYIKF